MTAAAFLTFVLLVAACVQLAAFRFLERKVARIIAFGIAFWLVYVGVLSWSGVVANTAVRPPAIFYIVGPVALFVLFIVARSDTGGRVALAIPLWLLIGFQTFRVGVELFLHQIWLEGIVPRMLTYEGANVDILVGASAPLIAWISTRGRNGERIAFAWNVVGLIALANVVGRAALTAPGPFALLQAEVANRAIGTFPYTFIAGFFAPLAIILHVLALRALATRRRATATFPVATVASASQQ